MSHEPPSPPADLPTDLVDILDECTPEQLRGVARYAAALGEHRDRADRFAEESADGEIQARPDDLPDGVPSKATITIKEINDNRYYYWQWRDGDRVRSQYKGPVDPDE